MSRVNPRLVYWIAGVHRDPKLTPAHRDVLTYLAVMKLDYGTGEGYCSIQALAGGRDWHPATVKRALFLAQQGDPPLLIRTKRGHYISAEVSAASSWKLVYPPIPTAHGDDVGSEPTAHRDDVGTKPTAHGSEANVALVQSQRRTGAPLTEVLSGSESSTEKKPRRTADLYAAPGFAEFWDVYPITNDKRAAGKAWPKALKACGGDPALIIKGAMAYRDDPQRKSGFTKYAATWLNGECWLNEPAPLTPMASRRQTETDAMFARSMERARAREARQQGEIA